MPFINSEKSTSSFGNSTKNASEFSTDKSYLLQENLSFLLMEDGGKINISYGQDKNVSSFTADSKS